MKKPTLYKTPIIVAWVMLLVGLLGAFSLAWVPLLVSDYDGMDGGFAFTVGGGFIVIIAVIVFVMYGKLNNDFRKMLAGDALLTYVMPLDIYSFFSQKQAEEIRSGNKAALIMILFFCVLFGIILGIAVDPLFILICLCIAVFFTAVYFITTAYRTKKVKRPQALVCLSSGGAYIFGDMHSWSLAGAWLKDIRLSDGREGGLPCPVVEITYLAMSGTIPTSRSVTIPILPKLMQQAAWAVDVIRNAYRI